MPGRALSLPDLRNLTDDELVERHDSQAETTVVGIQYFVDELNRRYQDRQTKGMLGLTKWITGMTVVISIATVVNLGIAVGILFVMLLN